MTNNLTWREFERAIAVIEEAAAPRGATIKSPDRIRDLTTGELREVDASIRFTVGTVDILITIECQNRSRKANDMWIEQLVTKKLKIGAAKTIAVSAKGFTKSARITAAHHGIELHFAACCQFSSFPYISLQSLKGCRTRNVGIAHLQNPWPAN